MCHDEEVDYVSSGATVLRYDNIWLATSSLPRRARSRPSGLAPRSIPPSSRAEQHRTRGVAARRGSNLLITVRDFGVLAIIALPAPLQAAVEQVQALTSRGDLNRDETRARQ